MNGNMARDAYYSGEPLVLDDMFDRVELKLKWYGSKSVVKYPRCSIRRHSTYADVDGRKISYQKTFDTGGLSYGSQASRIGLLFVVNNIIFMALGLVIGYPIASASIKVLQGLWMGDLAALKGSCPNCGEEVFTFVKTDKADASPHRVDCHVCECLLEFRTKVEQSDLRLGRQWVYGHIYLVRRSRR
ncbi:unnamed protein product [Sphenostylis stenocarpa]|uniref:Uncharacterized protein n=1 Tax=Sphenostylis stenocarpa TaxID=92480 RepID=A0AA86TEI8_9FABA|nr:unnamed protein product [Sphenostylis stenocarpa]